MKKVLALVALLGFLTTTSYGECEVDLSGMDVCADQMYECEEAPSGICVRKVCQEPVPDGPSALPCKLD